jgi:serpin B
MWRPGVLFVLVLSCCSLACIGQLDTRSTLPPGAVPDVVGGANRCAFDLYAQLRKRDGNLFFSPFSISTALAMTSAGARGETLAEMERVLHLPEQSQLHPDMARLLGRFNHCRGVELSVANALWGQAGKDFLPEFTGMLRRHYGAGMQQVDFARSSEQARQTINRWVERQTHDRIKDLLSDGVLDGTTRLVLTNAIYFKGEWASKFSPSDSRDDIFHTSPDRKVNAKMMKQENVFACRLGGDVEALEMPYRGGEMSMIILLPGKGRALSSLEQRLSAEQVAAWVAEMQPRKVEVFLPRIRLTQELQLKETLQQIGLASPFTAKADFRGMDGGKDPLWLTAVVHKAFVDVQEQGTEAAAATAATMSLNRASAQPEKQQFRVDRPCLFVIRDRKTGSILFLGRLADPTRS